MSVPSDLCSASQQNFCNVMYSVRSTLECYDTSPVISFNYQFHTHVQIDFIASPMANKQIDAELTQFMLQEKRLLFNWRVSVCNTSRLAKGSI